MSMITFTVPRSLNTLTLPSVDKSTVTALGVGAWPADQFRFDAFGNGASAGNTLKKPSLVGAVIVTLAAIETAPTGIAQLPFVPCTVNVAVSPGLSGVPRGPTVDGADRVSTRRHGVIDTNTGLAPVDTVARAIPMPPAPMTTATAAPIAAQRTRRLA